MKAKGKGHFRHPPSAIRHRAAALAVAAALACSGCGAYPVIQEGDYLTYDHPFSESAAAAARKNAEAICRQRDRVPFEASRACSLTQCTTSYQCMDDADAKRLDGEQKK